MLTLQSNILRLVSSALSVLGSLYITVAYVAFPELRSANRQLLAVLGVLDLAMALAYLAPVDAAHSPWCRVQAVSIALTASASIFWTTCIAYNVYCAIHGNEVGDESPSPLPMPSPSPQLTTLDPDHDGGAALSSSTPLMVQQPAAVAATSTMTAALVPSLTWWKYSAVTFGFAFSVSTYVLFWGDVSVERQGWCFSTPSYGIGLFYLPLWIIWALNIYFYFRCGLGRLGDCRRLRIIFFVVYVRSCSSRARLRRLFDAYLSAPTQHVAQSVVSKFLWVRALFRVGLCVSLYLTRRALSRVAFVCARPPPCRFPSYWCC